MFKGLKVIYVYFRDVINWACTWENVPSDMCSQRKHKSACASSQYDQSHRYPHEEAVHPWLSKIRHVKILIRLRECAVWSESSKGVHDRSYVFGRRGWTIYYCFLAYHCSSMRGRCLLFVLRFYGPVNPMGSCRARSVYLTTRLLGRLSPLSC